MAEQKIVGTINKRIVDQFQLDWEVGAEIYLGETNIAHMKDDHPEDFKKYFDRLEEILSSPTYICKHPKKDSVEYVKVFTESSGDHVLVAVRTSNNGRLYARTLFVMDDEKIRKYKKKNAFIPYKNT